MSREILKKIVTRHVIAYDAGMPSNLHTLVIGPTGCGKTYTIRETLMELDRNIPIITLDGSSLTQEGYKGLSLSEAFRAFASHPYFDGAIVYVDEFDKMSKTLTGDGQREAMQYNLLTALDGTEQLNDGRSVRDDTLVIDPSKMTFIFSGAFQNLWTPESKPMGFQNDGVLSSDVNDNLHERIIDYGFIKELVYRIPYIVKLEGYSKDEIRNIIKNNFNYVQMKDLFGVKIDLEEMIEFVHGHPAGARAIAIYLAKADMEELNGKEQGV